MDVYFDNAATTKVISEVREIMLETIDIDFGNPSSVHMKGVEAERYLRNARTIISRGLKCEKKEIIFTSGGTEANNLALLGICEANRRAGNHIITTSIEHASVYNPILHMENKGYRISFLPVDSRGIISVESLKQELCEETIIVSVMAVNNEIGAVEPLEQIAEVIRQYNNEHGKKIIFHVDAVQAFCKYKIYPRRIGIDAMSMSGHKIHGPKGSGALYVGSDVKINPIVFGGGQEGGIRSGTENTAAIAGMAKAVEIMYSKMEDNNKKMRRVKNALVDGATSIKGVSYNYGEAPHIVSLSFQGIKSEVMLHALESRGIYVSSGSACSSNHPSISGVLKAIGLDNSLLDSTLRFSLCDDNTLEEVEYVVDTLKELVPMLRKYTKR